MLLAQIHRAPFVLLQCSLLALPLCVVRAAETRSAALATTSSNAPLPLAESGTRGRAFLTNLFDATVDLLPEFPGSHTYWLFHDNYLAAHILAETRPD